MTLSFRALLLLLISALITMPFSAFATEKVGVVVMHGKGGRPGNQVAALAQAFEAAGFQVANLEMPWSFHRQYDVGISAGVDEITKALNAMRSKGATKLFVSGHSQGALFALHYASVHQVDGVIAVTPGGTVDAKVYADNISSFLAKAKRMIDEGKGDERSSFADFEGSRGTNTITTTAAIYYEWFNPNGIHTTRIFGRVKTDTPVLYVAPTRDYPALRDKRHTHFRALPSHPLTRTHEPDSDHKNAPAAAKDEAVLWIKQVSGL